jgi:hypothetical protein
MTRTVLLSCWPWLAVLLVLFVCLRLSVRLQGTRLDLRRLRTLHGDEQGSVQTLSFVLTLPVFVMVLLLIVQVSQIMIGTIVVHYAAFATARSAIVWIPAYLNDAERENCVSWYIPDPQATDQKPPVINPNDPNFRPTDGGMTFLVLPTGPKYEKIASAAAMACMPICPSRDLGLSLSGQGFTTAQLLKTAYLAMVPSASNNARVPRRLENKLAYALQSTGVEIRFFHPNSEPPLITYLHPPDIGEFHFNELGWQDLVTVKVTHQMALLPGPGRLLARRVASPDGSRDEVADKIRKVGNVYTYPLTASATLGLEGEKSMIRYVYHAY